MDAVKTVNLELIEGRHVELHMSPQLVNQIVEAFNLSNADEVTAHHVKSYLVSGMKKALGGSNERHTS